MSCEQVCAGDSRNLCLPSTPHRRPLLVQGLSHCYVKGDDGKLVDQYVIEPINANSIECMANGVWLLGWPVQRGLLGSPLSHALKRWPGQHDARHTLPFVTITAPPSLS